MVGVTLGVGVNVGVNVGVGVIDGQTPNTDIAPLVPTWNTSLPPTDLNHLSFPLNTLAGMNAGLVYKDKP